VVVNESSSNILFINLERMLVLLREERHSTKMKTQTWTESGFGSHALTGSYIPAATMQVKCGKYSLLVCPEFYLSEGDGISLSMHMVMYIDTNILCTNTT